MKFLGEDANIKSAANVFSKLIELSRRGNEITEQNVGLYPVPLRDQ